MQKSSVVKTVLYAQLAAFVDDLGVAPSALLATVTAFISDREGGNSRAVESLEEAVSYLQKEESIQ